MKHNRYDGHIAGEFFFSTECYSICYIFPPNLERALPFYCDP